MKEPDRVSIFFAWQSDLAENRHRFFIRQGLIESAASIQGKTPARRITIDEATSNTAGSPHIPSTILNKILEADMFVCDVTTIRAASGQEKPVPNPNVVYELGFAVATLGWDRIVLLFNEESGQFPDDMPFDFDRQRASPFKASDPPSPGEKAKVRALLTTAIQAIIDHDPAWPGAQIPPEQRKRQRDILQIARVLSTLHLPTIDEHIAHLPSRISDRALTCWLSLHGVVANSLYHIYDAELNESVIQFHNAFALTTEHDEAYHSAAGGAFYTFSPIGEGAYGRAQQATWDLIAKAARDMRIALDALLALVRAKFVEVDVEAASDEAAKELRAEAEAIAALQKRMGG
jgi:hypothetical protein